MPGDIRVEALERAHLDALARTIAAEVPELRLDSRYLARNLFEDPDAEPALLLAGFKGSRLAGVAASVRRGETAHLKLLVVDPSARRRGLGTRLLAETLERLAQAGVDRVETDGAAPCYLLPGLPVRCSDGRRLLEKSGFEAVEERSSWTVGLQGLDLATENKERALVAGGIAVRRAEATDRDLIFSEVTRLFTREWAVEAAWTVLERTPKVHVALRGGSLVGFACAGVWAANAFGPMGTSAAEQGRGVGEVLLKRSLADLRAAGEENALISWVGPLDFYRSKVGLGEEHRYVVLGRGRPVRR